MGSSVLARGDTADLGREIRTMEEENNQDQEFSILKKSVIPNLLQDDFKSCNENYTLEPTFLTEVCDEEVLSDNHEEKKAPSTADSMYQQEKRKCFEKDYDFRKTLINEESFENINEQEPIQSSTELSAEPSKLNWHIWTFCSHWVRYSPY
eukprot:TRINITY_DN18434_c0_g1_i1.p1 TRINITY_DN18434_c0_g1~~TRINITY_DN18434_c0_g1_i1.p1  ORF type:complete len:159 (-),score=43.01 TRINITY_DN18434_c0_g1_i1:129-581(-)